MKKISTVLVILAFLGCQPDGKPTNISTVDSNVINQSDTNPPILYLDNPHDSDFSIAVDSSAQTIESTQVN